MVPRIVIAGGGFGGAYCARQLEKSLGAGEADVLLIDRKNYFAFSPLLVEAGTGSLQPRHAVVSLRSFLRRARFRMARVEAIDLAKREIALSAGSRDGASPVERIPYDHLVIALGSVTKVPDVPGVAAHAFEMKSLTDAVRLRDRAIQMLELADAASSEAVRRSLLHFVVVGGNFTGAEVAGEFDVFLREASRRYRNIRPGECHITLVEMADRILGALDPALSEYALRQMRRRGIDVRLKTTVARIDEDGAHLSDGETIAARTVIWCAGIAPNPLGSRLGLPTDARGYILCERDLRVKGHTNVWAIGDCAVSVDAEGRASAPTAQYAVAQGKHLAKSLARVVRGESALPFDYRSLGATAALGCRTGVASVLGIKLSGFPAWFVWRTVYLSKMPGLGRKVRVALDWTLDLLFPRDYVSLGAHGAEPARDDTE